MSIQVKASFKKEITAFTRTKRFFILLCVFVGLAVFDPLILRGTGALMEAVSEAETLGELFGEMTTASSSGVSSLVNDLALAGLIVFLLLINGFAGGEQKKRSIIIPRTSGLRNNAYLTPKFIVYPAAAFVLTLLAVFVAAAVSASVFAVNDLVIPQVFAAAVLLGVNLMLYTCFHLCIGTATGKAGMSAAICIGASILVPGIFSVMSMGIEGNLIAYNPFALSVMAMGAVSVMPDTGEAAATVIIALAIMIACWLLALFAHNARRIDNKGNEILI
ncbi:MAG: hypothetical protein FWE74_01055 [Oscillospiraceae bacterium]|nr:hypothetical protein [Oscillospiraceae bacterium]